MSIHSGTVFGAGLAHAAVARASSTADTGPAAERFARLDAAAAEIEFGSDGLLFIPSLASPDGERNSDDSGGDFVGSAASPVHRYRSVLEGVALAIDSLVPGGSAPVRVGGGIRRSNLWLTILASTLESPIEIVEYDASPVGAAMLAGIGIGWFTSPADAAGRCVHVGRTVAPSPIRGLDAIKERFASLAGEATAGSPGDGTIQ
jgi:xylulokinase